MRTTICLPASLSHPCLPRLSWASSQILGIDPVLSCSPCSAQARGCHTPFPLARKALTLQECCWSFPNAAPKGASFELELAISRLLELLRAGSWCCLIVLSFSVWEDWAEREQEVCCVPVKPAAPSRLCSWNWDRWVFVLPSVGGGGGENTGLKTLLPLCVHPNETAIPWRRI